MNGKHLMKFNTRSTLKESISDISVNGEILKFF